MPYKSKAQRAYLEINEPEVAKEFEEHTTKEEEKNLPERVKDKNHLKEYNKKHRRKK